MGTVTISALGHERMANSVITFGVMRLSHGIELVNLDTGSAESERSSTAGSSSLDLIVKDGLKALLGTAQEQK